MDFISEYSSPLGLLQMASDGEALVGLWFVGQTHFAEGLRGEPRIDADVPVFSLVRAWLTRYFSGEPMDARSLPLAPRGTPFRQAVWQQLAAIPWGQTRTYGQMAAQLAAQRRSTAGSRAVGGAVAHNPISILIPCHRVVGAKGLVGYAGGLERKRELLRLEGVME